MAELLAKLDTAPEAAIAECLGADGMLAKLFRRAMVNGNIVKEIVWDRLMKEYLISLEVQAELEQGKKPQKRVYPTDDRFRSNATNLRTALTGIKLSFDTFHKSMRMLGAVAYSFEIKAKRPNHPLITQGEDVYASVALYTSEYDTKFNKGLESYRALSHLIGQIRYQLGLSDDEKFFKLIDEYSQQQHEKEARENQENHASTRNNNRKHLTREDLSWVMAIRGLAIMHFDTVEFTINLIRPAYTDLVAKEAINLTEPVVVPPPPPPPKPMKLNIPKEMLSLWGQRK